MNKIVIVGGGPSAFACAIKSAKENNDVTILERNPSVLKKLLITGNGKCNYFNDDQNINHYHSYNCTLLNKIITEENINKVKKFYDEIGLVPKIKNGYYYPYSLLSASVKEYLINTAENLNVKIITNYFVKTIKKENDKFIINNDIICDKVIIATGSKAYPNTGSDGNGYELAKTLNHEITDILPSLVQVKGNSKYFKKWDGIRSDVIVSLYEDDKYIKEETGEIQLTKYGLSGICIFNLSGIISKGLNKNKKEEIKINFIPFIKSISELEKYLEDRNNKLKNRNLISLLEGIINYKLINLILDELKIDKNVYYNKLNKNQKEKLFEYLISFNVKITETNSFDKSQVCSGGIKLSDINNKTMESLIVKNLYFIGEILDLDGDCGGYNLTIAFLTGILSGESL